MHNLLKFVPSVFSLLEADIGPREHFEHSILEGAPPLTLLLARTQTGAIRVWKTTKDSVGRASANSVTFNSCKHLPVSGKAGKLNSGIPNSGTS